MSKRYRQRFGMPDGKVIAVPVRVASAADARDAAIAKLCEGYADKHARLSTQPAVLAALKPGELGKRWRCPFCGSRHFNVEPSGDGIAFRCVSCGQGAIWSLPAPGSYDEYDADAVARDGWQNAVRGNVGMRTGEVSKHAPWQRQFKP